MVIFCYVIFKPNFNVNVNAECAKLTVTYNNMTLQKKSDVKFLGIHIDENTAI